jgi:hypothetical protein
MPSAAWPMLLHDARHTGCATGFGPATFAAGWSASSLGPFSGVAVDAGGRVLVASTSGKVTCLNSDGTQAWSVSIAPGVAPGPPALGASGKVYVANGDVLALDPANGAQLWKYPRAQPYTTVTAPLAIGADETVYALTSTSTSGQPNQLLAIATGTLKWGLTLPYSSTSTPAMGGDGTLYLGCSDGLLRAISTAGAVLWTWAANGRLPGPPSIGLDGTVHIGVQASLTQDNALVALTPPTSSGQAPTVRWRYSPSPGEYLSAFGGLAIAPDGTLYAGFDALHAIHPDGSPGWSTPVTDAERSPGPVAVGVDGTVYFVSAAGTLWAYDATGTMLWSTSIATGGQASAPALGPSGAIYLGDGQGTLRSSTPAPAVGARLAAIYSGLLATRTATGTGGEWSYPLNATSIADAPVLALVQAALGAQPGTLTAPASALRVHAGTVVLTGTGSFLGAGATITLTFGASATGNDITLDFSAALAAGATLTQLLPALAGTLFEHCSLQAASFAQSSSTAGALPTSWQLTATTDPRAGASPLAESARLLSLSGAQTVSGTVAGGSQTAVSLQVGAAQPLPLVGFTGLTATLWLETSPAEGIPGALLCSVAMRSTLAIGGHPFALRAEAPREAGISTFTAKPASAQQVSLTDLALWGDPTRALADYVPPSMRDPSQTFGLEQVEVGFLTTGAVQWIGFTLTAPEWKALSAGNVGIDLSVKAVTLDIVCALPFETPALTATLSGTIASTIHTQSGSSTAEFAVTAVAPDFQIYGSLVEGTQIKLQDVLSAMSGSTVVLPCGVPAPVVEEIELYAQPWVGTFALGLAGNLNWTLFQIGANSFGLSEFGIAVERLQAANDLTHPTIAATLSGRLQLGGFSFDLIGDSPTGSEGWDLQANLVSPVAFPSIGSLVASFNQSWADALPPELASAGQQINLKQLQLTADQAPSTHRAIALTIGTLPSWPGWTVLSSPVTLALTAVDLQLLADSTSGLSGSMSGAVTVGSGKVAMKIALPWSSGAFEVSYTAGNEGLTLPSIDDLRAWLVPSLQLPAEVAAMGALDLQAFSLTAKVDATQTTLELSASAFDPSHQWVVVAGSPPRLAVQNLTVKAHRDASTSSGAIGATLVLSGGRLPLTATMKDSWSSYTIGLDTNAPVSEPPTVSAIIGLVSQTLLDALPAELVALAGNIAITEFQAAVTQTATTFTAAVGAKDQNAVWHPVPGVSRFGVQALALNATASTDPAVTPGGAILGTIVVGAHGRIPLRAALGTSTGTISLTLNPQGGTATMPTLGDLVELVSSSWAGALPETLAQLGAQLQVSIFALSATASTGTWSIEVKVATLSSWSGYQPIAGFTQLTFTSASASLKSGSGSTATSGTLECAAQVLGHAVTFTLTLPEGVFTARLTTGLTLSALASYVLGTSAGLPRWLQSLGLPEIDAQANFRQNVYTLAAVLAQDIPLTGAGKLKSLRLEARFGGAGDPKVCLTGIWETVAQVEVPGRICYPFETFLSAGENPIPDFPPEGPPDVPPPSQETLDTLVEDLIAQDTTAGAAASIAYYGYNAGVVATGVALAGAGIALAVNAKALADTWRLSALELARTLSSVAAQRHTTITAAQMAGAIAAAYPSGVTAAVMADALACAYTLSAVEMVGALKAAPYSAALIAPVIKSRYAPLDATAMIATLEQGWQPDELDAASMIGALAAAGYDAVSAAAPFHTAYAVATATGAQFATLYAAAGFTPALTAQTLASSLASAQYAAGDAIAGLRTAFPQQVPTPSAAVPFLHGAGYSAQQVVAALSAEVTQAASMATLLHDASYSAPQAGPALAQGYPTQLADAPALLALLGGTWTPLSLADAAAALAGTSFTPQAVAAALRAVAAYQAQLDTAAKTATVLHQAYGARLALPGMLLALAASSFPAYSSAAAAAPLYTTANAANVASALGGAYPALTALTLAAALAAAAFPANEVRAGVLAWAPSTPTGVVTVVVAAVGAPTFAASLGGAASARANGEGAPAAAHQLVAATPSLAPDVLVAAIAAVYAPPAPALTALAGAIVPAYPSPSGPTLAGALLLAEPASTPSELGAALAAGFAAASAALSPADLAGALVAAYAGIGAPTSETPVAQALVAVFSGHTPALTEAVAAALAHAFPATTPAASLAALAGALTGRWALPAMTVAAVAQALAIPSTSPLALVQALDTTYQLNRCPVAVGSSSLAMMRGGFDMIKVSEAFSETLQNWTVEDYGTLLNVYQESAHWLAAWTAASAGQTAPEAVQALNTRFAPGAARLVEVVIAAYCLIDPLAAATPLASGLKLVGVSLTDALAALHGFFGADWTAAAIQAVNAVYASTTDHREEMPMTQTTQTQANQESIREIVETTESLLAAALGCKKGGFLPVACARQIYENTSPTPTAGELAGALAGVWACLASNQMLVAALESCNAWDAPTIASVAAATLHLSWLDAAELGQPKPLESMIGLFQGDLTSMTSAESVPLLAISTLPGDYQPTPGSVIAALAAHGVSVAALAEHMALDRRAQSSCWVSQPIAGQSFGQLLVFESSGANAPGQIPGVMATIQALLPTPPTNLTVACSMLSTGSAGANPETILTALFNAAKATMRGGYALAGLKIVNYQQAWDAQLTHTFDQLKAGV